MDAEQKTSIQRGIAFLFVIGIAAAILFRFPPNEKVQRIIDTTTLDALWHLVT